MKFQIIQSLTCRGTFMRRIIVYCILFLLLISPCSILFGLTRGGQQTKDNAIVSFPTTQQYILRQHSSTMRSTNDSQENTWFITDSEEIINKTSIIDNSITIRPGGRLLIENSKVMINSSVLPVIITVENGGALIINNSNITSFNVSIDIGYSMHIYGSLVVNNSELNHLCYETGVTQLESCGGIIYDNKYSPGIEIYSDAVEIANSEIKFAKNTSLYIEAASPVIYGNIFSNNIKSIIAKDSKLVLWDNQFDSNFIGIYVVNCDLTLQNNLFSYNWNFGLYGELSNIKIKNTIINYTYVIINSEKCSISIENSSFFDNNYLWFYDSEVYLYNTTISKSTEEILFNNVTATISQNIFDRCYCGLRLVKIKNSVVDNNSFYNSTYCSIEIQNSQELFVKDNYLSGSIWGILIYDSTVSIINNTITDSSLIAIGEYGSNSIIRNNLITNNSIGIGTQSSTTSIKNNIIVENIMGITCVNSDPSIIDNLIANNSEWGINNTDSDPILSGNRFSDEDHQPNGLGRIIRLSEIRIYIRDSYDNQIEDAKISVVNKNNTIVINRDYGSSGTLFLPVYQILNNGVKEEFNPYIITGSWGDENNGYTTASKTVSVSKSMTINITLPLPDLYITSSDIQISDISPKHGDKINFAITIHYAATQVPANEINVTLTANGGIIKRFPISFNSSTTAQSQIFQIPWEVVAFKSEDLNIRVTIDPSNTLENHQLNYEDNNIANTTIDVEAEPLRLSSSLTMNQVCGIIILIIVILILIIIGSLYRKRVKGQKKSEFETDLKSKPDGKQKQKNGKTMNNSKDNKKASGKKTIKEKMIEDLNRDISPRIKW